MAHVAWVLACSSQLQIENVDLQKYIIGTLLFAICSFAVRAYQHSKIETAIRAKLRSIMQGTAIGKKEDKVTALRNHEVLRIHGLAPYTR